METWGPTLTLCPGPLISLGSPVHMISLHKYIHTLNAKYSYGLEYTLLHAITMHFVVFYPLEPGEYVPIVFIPGLYGLFHLIFTQTL